MLQILASCIYVAQRGRRKGLKTRRNALACDRDILILKLHKIIVIICKSGILKLHGIIDETNIDIVKKQVIIIFQPIVSHSNTQHT